MYLYNRDSVCKRDTQGYKNMIAPRVDANK